MTPATKRRLVHAAAKARRGAVAPYSRFSVGAAWLSRSGDIITGANIESASFGLTCCAERVALFSALSSGNTNLLALAIVARVAGGPMPCGACRQVLAEYAPHASVWSADSRALETIHEYTVAELLPRPFLTVPMVKNSSIRK